MISDVLPGTVKLTPRDLVVILTGGGSGIGRATSDLLAAKGASLVLVGRRREPLERAARAAVEMGAEALVLACDLADSASAPNVVRQARDRFEHIDILVNNAAVPGEGVPLHEVSDELWDEICETNLTAPFRMCRALLPIFVEQGRGTIVNVSSTAALVSMTHMAAYSAAKSGLLALTKAVALDYGPMGVRCNAVCPGITATPMTANVLSSPKQNTALSLGIPLRRIAEAREIAGAILFLCSHEASYVNGTVLTVDGGQSVC